MHPLRPSSFWAAVSAGHPTRCGPMYEVGSEIGHGRLWHSSWRPEPPARFTRFSRDCAQLPRQDLGSSTQRATYCRWQWGWCGRHVGSCSRQGSLSWCSARTAWANRWSRVSWYLSSLAHFAELGASIGVPVSCRNLVEASHRTSRMAGRAYRRILRGTEESCPLPASVTTGSTSSRVIGCESTCARLRRRLSLASG